MMGRLNARNKELLKRCIIAIFNNNIKEVEHNLLVIGEAKGNINHTKLCHDLELILDKNKSMGIKDINITIKSYPANGNNHIYLGTEMVKDADGYNVSYYKNQELDNIKDVSISVDNVFITNLQNYDEFINIKNSNIETAGKIDSLLEIYTNLK